jgi:hypothetical protein
MSIKDTVRWLSNSDLPLANVDVMDPLSCECLAFLAGLIATGNDPESVSPMRPGVSGVFVYEVPVIRSGSVGVTAILYDGDGGLDLFTDSGAGYVPVDESMAGEGFGLLVEEARILALATQRVTYDVPLLGVADVEVEGFSGRCVRWVTENHAIKPVPDENVVAAKREMPEEAAGKSETPEGSARRETDGGEGQRQPRRRWPWKSRRQ